MDENEKEETLKTLIRYIIGDVSSYHLAYYVQIIKFKGQRKSLYKKNMGID
jgi:hypothetical protein